MSQLYRIPQNDFARPKLSLALIGNQYTQPVAFPPWIDTAEQGSFFCVSESDSRALALQVLGGVCLLCVAIPIAAWSRKPLPTARRWHESSSWQYWNQTIQRLKSLSIACCVLLPLYSNGFASGSCWTLLQRMTFQVLSTVGVAHHQIQIAFSLWLCHELARFCWACSPSTRLVGSTNRPSSTQPSRRPLLNGAVIWNAWLVVSSIASLPFAIYSFVKTIPGLISLPPLYSRVLEGSTSMIAACLTSYGLPKAARWLCQASDCKVGVGELLLTDGPIATCGLSNQHDASEASYLPYRLCLAS
eukprot:514153-Amphidinium_carterae.1